MVKGKKGYWDVLGKKILVTTLVRYCKNGNTVTKKKRKKSLGTLRGTPTLSTVKKGR